MVLYEHLGRDIDRGLVGYWKLDDKKISTSIAIDRINFNDGAITGATNTDGQNWKPTTSMNFDGTDDYISVAGLDPTTQSKFTISFWIFLDEIADSDFERIIDTQDSGPENGFLFSFGDTGTSDRDQIDYIVKNGASAQSAIKSGVLVVDAWYHVVGTYEVNSTELFINNVSKGADSTVNMTPSSATLNFGRRSDTNASFYKGKLSRVRIYDRVLTQGEISKLYRLKL